ncbi:MAG: snoRNA-binding rRNA-processing protein utp10 [Alectoria sarmentosa]|nr:MAG: snoRNA-binding rRNA-processing protein utp10 [Alectoria sarmentosa]
MATALASQLAQIRAYSTNPLDLKAQKKAHSRSLLYEPGVAASQDFDSLYQICYEGFQELCRLDSRFDGFDKNLFSEQSKQEDRTQMTAAQNQQLDVVLEEFLHLVSSRLLLKPALKAVEWLIRRFRVHQNNTLCLVLAILPFHTTLIFPTMLSLISENISPTLRFLRPYVQSLANPPRHAIVHAASINRQFLTAMSAHVLKSGRLGLDHPALVSLWASVATEAVAAMLDQGRSTRREAQKQNQEDIILFLLPIINDGLSVDNVPDLRVGCYMILIILASKADLDDDVISLMMEAVTSEWSQTSHAGLICLGILAEQKRTAGLPRKAFRAVIALEHLDDDLMTLNKHYKIDKLVLGVALGIVSGLRKTRDTSGLRLLKTLVQANILSHASTKAVVKSINTKAQTTAPNLNPFFDVRGSLEDHVLRLCDPKDLGTVIHSSIEESDSDMGSLENRLHRVSHNKGSTPEQLTEDVDMEDADEQMTTDKFEAIMSRIPTRTAYEISFLSHSDSYVYGSLAHAFLSIYTSTINLERFSDLPVLRKSLGMTKPLFLSFFVRIWCGHVPAKARTAAVRTVVEYIRKETLAADVQMLLPYIMYALADTSPSVRRAAADLVLVLAAAYGRIANKGDKNAKKSILGQQQIYGQGGETQAVTWLSSKEAARIISDLMVPGLEECMLDESHVFQLLSDNLNGPKHSKGSNATQKEMKTSLRLALFSSLCSHVVNTPLYAVKFRLLQVLNQVPKVGSTSRTKLLLPLLSNTMKQGQFEFERICDKEHLVSSQLLDSMASIITPSDREGIQTLKCIIGPLNNLNFPNLRATALHRLHVIWTFISIDLQFLLAKALFESAVGNVEAGANDNQEAEAMETLRTLPLSTAILQYFTENLPSISSTFQDKLPVSKRRRISHCLSDEVGAPDGRNLASAIRQITFVLELVGDAKTERHPELLGGLFQIMCDLQHFQSRSITAIGYLQVLAIEGMLAIVKRADARTGLKIDHASVRSDVLIDCIRTTANPQVRNSALLLVSALAMVAPELILHSIMPIFTFMGTNVLRQQDDFSAYVVKQTMDSVIPRLVQSLHNRKDGPLMSVSELLLSFAAAYEHISPQRRLDLFVSLVNKVGPNDYLFALLTILLDKFPGDRSIVQFAVDLSSRYDVKTRLHMVKQYLDLILDARKPKPTFSKSLLQLDDVDGAISNLFPLAPAILSDANLVSEVFRRSCDGGEDAANIRALFANILEDTFILSEHYKRNETLNVLCMQLLDASLGMLPISELIESLLSVFARTEDNIRLQVLRSFGHRLNDNKLDLKASQAACLAFLPNLESIVEESSDVSLKHTAVVCMDRIAELFGKKDVAAIIASARVVAGNKCLRASESSLRTISMLCLATMIEVSSDSFISILPLALPEVMDSLSTSIEEDTEDGALHNAVYSFLSALILYVPWMVIGADLDLVLKLSFESANAGIGRYCDQIRIEALRLVPKNVEARECLAALDRTWTIAVMEGPRAVREHLEIFHLAIDRYPKSMIVQHSETLGGLFLKMFDLRRIQLSPLIGYNYDIAEIGVIEDTVNESAISMVYKLNDKTFRPMFSRMLEWTTFLTSKKDMKATIHRQITWYTFLLKFFGTLKSIVTSYATFIIDDAAEILEDCSLNDEDSLLLWRQVILTLQRTLEHDQDDFYQSPSHFAPISAALLGQLGNAHKTPLLPELIPAITELAVATDSSTHHKEMNAVILKCMRSEIAAVRLAAVQSERNLTERLGEEWLALLPEMLPFISEVLEDGDEAVEHEVQRWVVGIEGILGESLNPMLQ